MGGTEKATPRGWMRPPEHRAQQEGSARRSCGGGPPRAAGSHVEASRDAPSQGVVLRGARWQLPVRSRQAEDGRLRWQSTCSRRVPGAAHKLAEMPAAGRQRLRRLRAPHQEAGRGGVHQVQPRVQRGGKAHDHAHADDLARWSGRVGRWAIACAAGSWWPVCVPCSSPAARPCT